VVSVVVDKGVNIIIKQVSQLDHSEFVACRFVSNVFWVIVCALFNRSLQLPALAFLPRQPIIKCYCLCRHYSN